ncbi:hypothetical protein E0493_17790 [Roseomonas sp. M0104]|uniref:Uncharacterized protein n=1 Tax=Teichococcus coralli TaxID=2545983 RepID=A0A845BDK6_9PROT|nr:hypothetical protein [Pseudoroseomonas coralli]MXP65201.1 hypothetical protein [Pseudoroseomonas coralli]
MTERPEAEPIFTPAGSSFQRILLRCTRDCEVDDEVHAYVQGIKVGQVRLQGSFAVGDKVGVPVHRLPLVDLPAAVRLAGSPEITGDAEALVLRSPDTAVALVGAGELKVDGLELSQGMLRGFAVNRVNGLYTPVLFARLNGLLVRPVSVERPRLLDDGGCSFAFAVQLYPADMGESGFSAEIFAAGSEAPIATFQYARSDGDDLLKRILTLESQLAQVRQMASLQIASLTTEFRTRLEAQQERIDAFIDYASCLMFDQLAVEPVSEATGLQLEADEGMRQRLAEFRRLIAAAPGETAKGARNPASLPREVQLELRSEAFNFGWHDVEVDQAGEFRWMGQSGIILNPAPARRSARVALSLRHVFKVGTPLLRVFLDGQEVDARISPATAPDAYTVEILRATDEPSLPPFQTLRLDSFVAGSPVEEGMGSMDHRILSVAVSAVHFEYLDGAN